MPEEDTKSKSTQNGVSGKDAPQSDPHEREMNEDSSGGAAGETGNGESGESAGDGGAGPPASGETRPEKDGETGEAAADIDDEDEDVYPLRPPEHDAKWAVRTVKFWMGVLVFLIGFTITMAILGTSNP